MNYLTEYCSTELNIKNSRFIAELFPVTSQMEARELLKMQKNKYADSTHVVHAFVIGKNAEILGMSDDGEPSGTAGRPALDVLKGSNCTNVMLTVTRYFGGTLLGTGGLVKAYGDSCKEVLNLAFEKNFVKPLIKKCEFSFSTDYTLYEKCKRLMSNFSITDLFEEFETEIKIKGSIVETEFENFAKQLIELSNGKITL
ncbi:MAG: YigZ family protein [Treponema sp.]|nr:YigZ family protein [Treponema sp.]